MEIKGLINPTIEAIYRTYSDRRESDHRPHLGGSQIGHSCSRALWYQFRWAASSNHHGRLLRLFEHGDLEEIRLVKDLRAIGVEVWEVDDGGGQFRFTAHGGHFALSLDGVGKGFEEAPKTPHVLEFKTSNEKRFKAMKSKGLEESNPQYWAQVHIGMLLSDLDRAYFFMVNKNTDEIYGERVKLDKVFAEKLLEKAGDIIFTDTPPPKIAETDDWWECKFCRYRFVCQRKHIPEVNCRTCAHSTPEQDGSWSCAVGGPMETCPKHLFNPRIMPWEVHGAGEDYVEYVDDDGSVIRNQENSYELRENCRGPKNTNMFS